MSNPTFVCIDCGLTKPINKEGGTGYATDKNGNKICYTCVGIRDRKELAAAKPGDKFTHYLTKVYHTGHYNLKVTRDKGFINIGTYATSPQNAIANIMEAEHCQRADVTITEYPAYYYKVQNWPDTMQCGVNYSKQSFHNLAGKNGRTDIWFSYEGKQFWGVNIGDNQLLRITCIKKK